MRTVTVHTQVTSLPDPEVLRARCRALALLDALMDNGSGDQYAIAFDPAGVFLHGFGHECAATPPLLHGGKVCPAMVKLPVHSMGYVHSMVLWGKRTGMAVAYGALVGVVSRLWEDTWSESLSFGISMAVLMLGIFSATDIRKRAGKN
ncbi:hypothetical protein [Streptomyces fungicidicus]|uniref:hypothetical protein n=1 Tax=Streptomyces fungicidicus TaxID=68203 RepID=UPI00223B7FF9|nr:hypothetical protein [Streptomyces fungicidicus]